MTSYPDRPEGTTYHPDGAPRDAGAPSRIPWETLEIADAFARVVPLLIDTLSHHWSTGQGTRVRHILWSLYTCSHLVNLGDACSGLDRRLAEAVATAIAARLILGPDAEPALRGILKNSGEFARFERMEAVTPDHLPILYPPAPLGPTELRRIADAMDRCAVTNGHP